jgi:site-specific DNA recombinase
MGGAPWLHGPARLEGNLSAWTDTKRPDFDKALSALKRGEVPALWCYAVDRFSRRGAGVVIGLLDAGTRLIFDYERLDSADPRDRERIIIDAERAKSASDLMSHRVKDTKQGQRKRGEWLGAAPYGLAKDREGKLQHGEHWSIVLRIFNEVAAGYSGRTVAARLNARQPPVRARRQVGCVVRPAHRRQPGVRRLAGRRPRRPKKCTRRSRP